MNIELYETKLDREMTSQESELPISNSVPLSATSTRKSKGRSGKLLDTGWSSIPNCSEFHMPERKLNQRWLSLGLELKEQVDPLMKGYKNASMNKYMKYQIKRLYGLKSDPIKFWKICILIIKHSSSFRVSATNHILNKWYKEIPYYKVIQANKKVDKLVKNLSSDLQYKRVYLPKKDTFRPLGVPTVEWRIYLHMINNFLHMFAKDILLPTQHGFIPGRGTLTAWKEIMAKVIDKPFIYECDLKQFFPSVDLETIDKILEDLNVPYDILTSLFYINKKQPILPSKQLLDESVHLNAIEYEKVSDEVFDLNMAFQEKDPHKIYLQQRKIEILRSLSARPTGVPQGAPTSPFQAILTLTKWFLKQTPSVSYADDPIFYDDKNFRIMDDPNAGIVLHRGKSGWVKREGKWLTDLKYLGLRYDPLSDSLFGNTRKGSRLELSSEFRDKILQTFTPLKDKNWSNLFQLPDIGMLFSRLYVGTWKADKISQNFHLLPEDKSWTARAWSQNPGRPKSSYSVFNVSSLASFSLAHKLTKLRSKRNYYVYKHASYKRIQSNSWR